MINNRKLIELQKISDYLGSLSFIENKIKTPFSEWKNNNPEISFK
jgi:hypothetical protein